MPITIYPGTVKKRNTNGTYSDLIPGADGYASEIEELQDIAGDGQLSGFTATDLTGAANELKNTLNTKADQSDLASLNLTGTTNTTGSQIDAGTYFYLNGVLVKAKTDIASGAIFTDGTNYEVVTAGALNDLKTDISAETAAREAADTAIQNNLTTIIRTGSTNTGTQIESRTYFYLDGTLKRATQTIANGSAFTSSNCVSVTVGEELTTLNSGLTNLIKNTSITGVTDSSGNIAITGLNVAQNFIISIIGNTGYAAGVVASGGVYYAKIVGNTNPITPLADTSITLYVRYL